ncbi:MAG: ATP-binding protein [Planctomycetota bacterium]|nr:ATP-binding protein [Planctomycetota bacterium]
MQEPPSQVIDVGHAGRVVVAQETARTFARSVGFGEVECEQIAIAVSELSTNLVKHANGGTITLARVANGSHAGVQIEAQDRGPGIPSAEQATTDGFSTAGGLGLGLGAVNRLMDELTFSSPPAGGTRVVCRRWLRPVNPRRFPHLLDFGVATRPRQGTGPNGDAFVARSWPDHALVGVIDGLGHGELAHRAAQGARLFIEDHFDQPLPNLFAGAERVCRGTRGVVMALARFDLPAATFSLASVGNVEARLWGSSDARNFVVRRGIIGVNAPKPVVTTHAWTPESTLVLHSDGLRTHWDWSALPRDICQNPSEVALFLLRTLGKESDDATVVVVRNAGR